MTLRLQRRIRAYLPRCSLGRLINNNLFCSGNSGQPLKSKKDAEYTEYTDERGKNQSSCPRSSAYSVYSASSMRLANPKNSKPFHATWVRRRRMRGCSVPFPLFSPSGGLFFTSVNLAKPQAQASKPLKLRNNLKKIARARIAFRAKHTHQTFRGFLGKVA
jgi:hypothetical protein